MSDSVRSKHQLRLEELKTERSQYHPLWEDIDAYVSPGRLRMDPNAPRGNKKLTKIIDETAILAHRTMMSGMHSGLTNPTRPWFKITPQDRLKREVGPIKTYLDECEKTIRGVLRQSNIYNALHSGYGDEGLFGQMAMLLVGDARELRAITTLTGQFWLATDQWGRVDTLYRRIRMTVSQVVARFVRQPDGSMDWSRVSQTVKNLWDKSKDSWVEIYHAVEPRHNRDRNSKHSKHKPWTSNYWEDGADSDVMLSESGFDVNRILAPRWNIVGDDIYSSMHPGEMCLPSVKMLQSEQKMKGKGISKQVDPPMTGPTSLQNQPVSTLPGRITFVDDPTGRNGLRSVYDVNLDLGDLREDIQDVRNRIERIWFADLFFAITKMDGVQPRNELEITSRREEQLLQLGPVIEGNTYDLINPLVELAFYTCEEAGLFPDPPEELSDSGPLDIENISILAQAQRAVAIGSIERTIAFTGQLAAVKPDIIDKVDLDQAIDEYSDAAGAPASIVRSDESVEEIRAQRAEQMAQRQQMETLSQLAPAVKDGADAARLMSEAQNNTTGQSLLEDIGLA